MEGWRTLGKSDIVSFDRGVWVSASACIDSVEVHGQGNVWFGDEVSKMNRTAYERAVGTTIDVRWMVNGVLFAVSRFSIFYTCHDLFLYLQRQYGQYGGVSVSRCSITLLVLGCRILCLIGHYRSITNKVSVDTSDEARRCCSFAFEILFMA